MAVCHRFGKHCYADEFNKLHYYLFLWRKLTGSERRRKEGSNWSRVIWVCIKGILKLSTTYLNWFIFGSEIFVHCLRKQHNFTTTTTTIATNPHILPDAVYYTSCIKVLQFLWRWNISSSHWDTEQFFICGFWIFHMIWIFLLLCNKLSLFFFLTVVMFLITGSLKCLSPACVCVLVISSQCEWKCLNEWLEWSGWGHVCHV